MTEEKENSVKKAKTGSFIKELLSGSMISEKLILKNLGYVSLLTLLAAIYIGNRFHAEKLTRQTIQTTKGGKGSESRSPVYICQPDVCFQTIGSLQTGQGKRTES